MPVNRTPTGIRVYSDQDISRLRFIKRAQKMNFTLVEISDLIRMRTDPRHDKDEVRQLTAKKLDEV